MRSILTHLYFVLAFFIVSTSYPQPIDANWPFEPCAMIDTMYSADYSNSTFSYDVNKSCIYFQNSIDFSDARFTSFSEFSRSEFNNTANFNLAKFDGITYFEETQFTGSVSFQHTKFAGPVYFISTIFFDDADFLLANFYDVGNFSRSHFKSRAKFEDVNFRNQSVFHKVNFNSLTEFKYATFYNKANFNGAHFGGFACFTGSCFLRKVDFDLTTFAGHVDFKNAQFEKAADFNLVNFNNSVNFSHATFVSKVSFQKAHFESIVDFSNSTFLSTVDFRETFISLSDFSNAHLYDSLFVGMKHINKIPAFDFRFANFLKDEKYKIDDSTLVKLPGARIILCAPVKLKMQIEKFEFLSFLPNLDYYSKKNIITVLKEESYNKPEQSKQRFEIDYLFYKSTMFQKKSSSYELKFNNPLTWPDIYIKGLYYITMGLGYRPFRLLFWVVGIIFLFSLTYAVWMPNRISAYIAKDGNDKPPKENQKESKSIKMFSNYLNSLYFSCCTFFTFRFRKDILLFFNRQEKILIAIEWTLGFIIYFSFIAFSKQGSILHTLTALFSG